MAPWAQKNAHAVQGAERRTNDYCSEEIHELALRCRWFRQLIIGVKSCDLTKTSSATAQGSTSGYSLLHTSYVWHKKQRRLSRWLQRLVRRPVDHGSAFRFRPHLFD